MRKHSPPSLLFQVNHEDYFGECPLSNAFQHGGKELVDLLLVQPVSEGSSCRPAFSPACK